MVLKALYIKDFTPEPRFTSINTLKRAASAVVARTSTRRRFLRWFAARTASTRSRGDPSYDASFHSSQALEISRAEVPPHRTLS